MNEQEAKASFCPSCQGLAMKTGNEIACESCDAVFIITKKDGARVKEMGPIADHEERITALEGKAPKAEEQEPEQVKDDEDGEI